MHLVGGITEAMPKFKAQLSDFAPVFSAGIPSGEFATVLAALPKEGVADCLNEGAVFIEDLKALHGVACAVASESGVVDLNVEKLAGLVSLASAHISLTQGIANAREADEAKTSMEAYEKLGEAAATFLYVQQSMKTAEDGA